MDPKILTVLEEIRDGQKQQLQKQEESVALQRAHFEKVNEQFARANAIQDRAEQMQKNASQLVSSAKKSAIVIIPMIVVLLLCTAWLIARLF